jgi:glutaconate CoA-transferase subunit A
VPALIPDVAIIHVQETDELGNARIIGTRFEDVLMAQAAKLVIVTAERIVDGTAFEAAPEIVAIPGFLVHAVVEAPRGAWPCSCAGEYDVDMAYLTDYVAASKDAGKIRAFVEDRIYAGAMRAA